MKNFLWNRHLYAVGAVDVETGKVMECHTAKQMASWDYDRDYAFSWEQGRAMITGQSLEFEIDSDGTVVFDPHDVEQFGLDREQRRLLEQVLEQIKIR